MLEHMFAAAPAAPAPRPAIRPARPHRLRRLPGRPSRRQILRRRAFALLLVAVAAVATSYLWPGPSSGARPGARYIVRPGETVWAIAARAHAGDPRAYVAAIREQNHLDGVALQPGQALVLP